MMGAPSFVEFIGKPKVGLLLGELQVRDCLAGWQSSLPLRVRPYPPATDSALSREFLHSLDDVLDLRVGQLSKHGERKNLPGQRLADGEGALSGIA